MQTLNINEGVLRRLMTLQVKGKLAHAYLFFGPAGVGKKETAVAIAKAMNCSKKDSVKIPFCDQCPSCNQISTGNHPDIRVIESSLAEPIKIDQMRALIDQSHLRSFFGGSKIFILESVENFTDEAANSFLKTLEEPSSDTLLILTSSVPENVLETIKSRCHIIYFPVFPAAVLTQKLGSENSFQSEEAHFLAHYTEGCRGRARRLGEEKFFERKNQIINSFILIESNEYFVKTVLADKGKTRELLDVLMTWVRDAMLVKSGVSDERLIHRDRINDLKRFSRQFPFGELVELKKEIVNMYYMLSENLNIKIPLFIIKERLWAK
jgi:DNA polymerase-3 subunit delta'